MYYTAVSFLSSYIGRANMDGSYDVELMKGEHMQIPSGVAIDFISKRCIN